VLEAAQAATGLSKTGLAKALGVHHSTLWRWMVGKRRMPVATLQLCAVLTLRPELAADLTAHSS